MSDSATIATNSPTNEDVLNTWASENSGQEQNFMNAVANGDQADAIKDAKNSGLNATQAQEMEAFGAKTAAVVDQTKDGNANGAQSWSNISDLETAQASTSESAKALNQQAMNTKDGLGTQLKTDEGSGDTATMKEDVSNEVKAGDLTAGQGNEEDALIDQGPLALLNTSPGISMSDLT